MKSVQMILSFCCFGALFLVGCGSNDCTQYTTQTSCQGGTYSGTACRWNPVAAASCSGTGAVATPASCTVTTGAPTGTMCSLNSTATTAANTLCCSTTTTTAVTDCTTATATTNCTFKAAVPACTVSANNATYCCAAGQTCASNVANCSYVAPVTTAHCSNS